MLWYVYKFEYGDLKQTRMVSGENILDAIFNIDEILREELKSSNFKVIYIRELYYDNW